MAIQHCKEQLKGVARGVVDEQQQLLGDGVQTGGENRGGELEEVREDGDQRLVVLQQRL